MIFVIAAHATAATANANKQALTNATVTASNAGSQSSSSPFSAILSALGLGDDTNTSPTIPTSSTQAIANTGSKLPSGQSVLTSRTQKLLAQKQIKSLKVLTPSQAALLTAQAQAPQTPTAAQAALASSLASNPSPSSSGWSINATISSVESDIKGGISSVLDVLGGSTSSTASPIMPPLAAPIIAGGGNMAAAKAQALSAANIATSANADALAAGGSNLASKTPAQSTANTSSSANAMGAASGSNISPSQVQVQFAANNAAQANAPKAQTAANTATSANADALKATLTQAMGLNQDSDEADSAMDASALQGARITAAKNPTADQMAASKQQAFANLKPAADVKATETQALNPDAGTSKPDSKDANAKGGDSSGSDNSQSASNANATPDSQQPAAPQPTAQPQQPNVTFATHVADNIAANTAAAGSISSHTGITAPATTVAVGPSPDQGSVATKLDTGSLAVTIAAKSIEGAKQFDIRLDPPELGRVDVKLSLDATGRAQAHLSVEKPATLDMLQKDSGSLQRSLKDSGIDLANNGLQFSLKNQQQAASTPMPRSRVLNINAAPIAALASTQSYAHGHARLDIRV